ncbi:MAG: FkbM family methyltransferase, partial [Terriglobales bacterium]
LVAKRADEAAGQLANMARALDQQNAIIRQDVANVQSQLTFVNGLVQRYVVPVHDKYSYGEETGEYRLQNPEAALIQHLRSFLPSRNALDIGAHRGDVSALLLSAGDRVFAFEPSKDSFARLTERFAGNQDFKPFPFAISTQDGNRPLFSLQVAPEIESQFNKDLSVYSTLVKHPTPKQMYYAQAAVEVQTRSLKSLHLAGQIPVDIGIVKIDTGGGDLDVIKGMGSVYYACVVTEFWDAKHYFSMGSAGLLPSLVQEMRKRGYLWHIVIYRLIDGTDSRFYANIDQSVENSWGNVAFFKEFTLFSEAYNWCSANLVQNETFR